MIEMQMRPDDYGDVTRLDTQLVEPVLKTSGAIHASVFHSVYLVELLVLLVAGAAVDENETRLVLDQEAAHAQQDAVLLVRLDLPLPQRARDNAEHRAAVKLLNPGLDRVDLE